MNREIMSNPESDSAKRGSRVAKLGEFATRLSATSETIGDISDLVRTAAKFIITGIRIYEAFSGKNPK